MSAAALGSLLRSAVLIRFARQCNCNDAVEPDRSSEESIIERSTALLERLSRRALSPPRIGRAEPAGRWRMPWIRAASRDLPESGPCPGSSFREASGSGAGRVPKAGPPALRQIRPADPTRQASAGSSALFAKATSTPLRGSSPSTSRVASARRSNDLRLCRNHANRQASRTAITHSAESCPIIPDIDQRRPARPPDPAAARNRAASRRQSIPRLLPRPALTPPGDLSDHRAAVSNAVCGARIDDGRDHVRFPS
jgi:hypothetical protein